MGVDAQIAEWRAYVDRSPAVDGRDVDELECHLRDQIAELGAAGLADDEAFLVAVKRMGEVDALCLEFAREHRGRLWKQLVLGASEEPERRSHWTEAVGFAAAAAVAAQVTRVVAGLPDDVASWLPRNLSLVVLPFLAAYFARRRRLDGRGWALTAAPFVVAGLLVNLYPYGAESASEVIVAIHLPVVLWFAVAYPYMGGDVRSHERRMDFVRFTGEWVIYYTLIALGGGVLMLLTALILEPVSQSLVEDMVVWVLPAGAAGAVVVAAWLVESKQQVVENMAPVLTMVFTPLFALMLTVAAATYAVTGVAAAFDRELLGVFDALLIVVLGLVLYAMSARDPARPAGIIDLVALLTVMSALALDGMVLAAMVARISDLGFTPNRVAALGLNLVLLVNLAGTAYLSVQLLSQRITFHRLERWQTAYLPVLAAWAGAVVVALPPLFAFD